jgi:hypothetical protein
MPCLATCLQLLEKHNLRYDSGLGEDPEEFPFPEDVKRRALDWREEDKKRKAQNVAVQAAHDQQQQGAQARRARQAQEGRRLKKLRRAREVEAQEMEDSEAEGGTREGVAQTQRQHKRKVVVFDDSSDDERDSEELVPVSALPTSAKPAAGQEPVLAAAVDSSAGTALHYGKKARQQSAHLPSQGVSGAAVCDVPAGQPAEKQQQQQLQPAGAGASAPQQQAVPEQPAGDAEPAAPAEVTAAAVAEAEAAMAAAVQQLALGERQELGGAAPASGGTAATTAEHNAAIQAPADGVQQFPAAQQGSKGAHADRDNPPSDQALAAQGAGGFLLVIPDS